MTGDPESATFHAWFKEGMGKPVKLDGHGDGGEIVIEFDRDNTPQALAAWLLVAGETFEVTIRRIRK